MKPPRVRPSGERRRNAARSVDTCGKLDAVTSRLSARFLLVVVT
jgi:hypothetical protein